MAQLTTIEFDHTFEAAHHLPDSVGLTTKECAGNHGHTYLVKVFLEASQLEDNFVVDFGTIKRVINEYDHAQILWRDDYEWTDFYDKNDMKRVYMKNPPTAENIAQVIYEDLTDAMPKNATVKEVWVQEGAKPGKTAWVKYREIAE